MLPKLALEIMKVAHPVRIFSKLATKCRLDFTHCLIAKQPSLGILEILINPRILGILCFQRGLFRRLIYC